MTGSSSISYYIRFRGRTTGPFQETNIRQMIRRGNVGRLHQLSTDAVTWRLLAEFDVFAPPKPHAKRRQQDTEGADTFDQHCPSCKAALRLQVEMHGRSIICPRCHNSVLVHDPKKLTQNDQQTAQRNNSDLNVHPDSDEYTTEHDIQIDSLAQAIDDDTRGYRSDDAGSAGTDTTKPHHRPRPLNTRGRLYDDTFAFAQEEECRQRRTAIIVLSSVVIAGFFWPNLDLSRGIAGGSSLTVHFMNIQGLGAEHLPGIMALILIYPLLGGIGALFTCIYAPILARGITLCCIGGLFAIIVFANQGSVLAARAIGALPGGSGMIMLWIFWFFGLSMIVVSIRVRRYRPISLAAYVIGAIGAGLYFLSLLLPVLPINAGGLWLATPFELMKTDVFLGIGALLHMLCLVAAGVLCAANTPKRAALRAVSNSQMSVAMITASMGILLIFILLAGLNQAGGNDNGFKFSLVAVTVLLKFTIFFGSLLLLIPIGVADLILTATLQRPTKSPREDV